MNNKANTNKKPTGIFQILKENSKPRKDNENLNEVLKVFRDKFNKKESNTHSVKAILEKMKKMAEESKDTSAKE